MKKTLVFLVLAIALVAAPAAAKEGLFAGAYLAKASISGGNGSESGFGFRVGTGFNKYFSLEGTYEDVKDLSSVGADFRINFPLTSLDSQHVMTVEPYVLFGYGLYELGATNSVDGTGTKFGFGVELYLFRELSVNAGWSKANVSFDAPVNDLDIKVLEFGIIYHFI